MASDNQSIQTSMGLVPKRILGRTNQPLSIVGFGGIVVSQMDPARAASLVSEVVDRGVNYFDVAPTYGNAQEILGPALEPHRDRCFLACKTTQRLGKEARRELEESLKLLRTDRFDVYQLHGLKDVEKDVNVALGPGGALEEILKARDEGKVRWIGFSAHSPEAAVLAIEHFDFDTILYPINIACHFKSQFDQRPLEKARERNMGIMALKAMARCPWDKGTGTVKKEDYAKCWYEPFTTKDDALRGLRFTLSQPGVASAVSPGEESLLRLALDLAPTITSMSTDELAETERFAENIHPIFS